MSRVYLDIEKMDHTIGAFNDYIENCKFSMRSIENAVLMLDGASWSNDEEKTYMNGFKEAVSDNSTYSEFIKKFVSFRDYLCYLNDRYKETMDFANMLSSELWRVIG